MDSFDQQDDFVRNIMNEYRCERCEEKDSIIHNNEERINDYIAYIKKQSLKNFKGSTEACTQTDIDGNTSNSSLDKSGGNLRSSHKILLSNYIRQFRVYLDNLEEEQSEKTKQMQQKLGLMASRQKIPLFWEEEEPDTSLVTKGLVQDIMSMSLDVIADLLLASSEEAPAFKTIDFGLSMQ
jgi:hypothetical protein